jgi:hypothetical protein
VRAAHGKHTIAMFACRKLLIDKFNRGTRDIHRELRNIANHKEIMVRCSPGFDWYMIYTESGAKFYVFVEQGSDHISVIARCGLVQIFCQAFEPGDEDVTTELLQSISHYDQLVNVAKEIAKAYVTPKDKIPMRGETPEEQFIDIDFQDFICDLYDAACDV